MENLPFTIFDFLLTIALRPLRHNNERRLMEIFFEFCLTSNGSVRIIVNRIYIEYINK